MKIWAEEARSHLTEEDQVTAGREAATSTGKINMGELLRPTHLKVVSVIAFVFFAGTELHELGKGLGASLRGFKDRMKGLADEIDGPRKPAQTIAPKANESLQ